MDVGGGRYDNHHEATENDDKHRLQMSSYFWDQARDHTGLRSYAHPLLPN